MKLLLFTIFFPILSYGAPMSCTEFSTSVNYTYKHGTSTNFQYYSGKLSYNIIASYIKFYNLQGFDSSIDGGLFDGYCITKAIEECSAKFYNSYVIAPLDTYETRVEFRMMFHSFSYDIFQTYVDDGTIILYDGILYSPEYPCTQNIFNNATTCCTSFVSAPEVNGSFPRCKYLRSRTIIHNPIDYSIMATSSMNYLLADRVIFLKGNLSDATDVVYNINGWEFGSTNGLNGSVFLPSGDVKFFFSTSFIEYFYAVPNVRLFLIRNEQILMKEGVPYTKDNDCQYFSVTDNRQKMPVSVEVCCKEFE